MDGYMATSSKSLFCMCKISQKCYCLQCTPRINRATCITNITECNEVALCHYSPCQSLTSGIVNHLDLILPMSCPQSSREVMPTNGIKWLCSPHLSGMTQNLSCIAGVNTTNMTKALKLLQLHVMKTDTLQSCSVTKAASPNFLWAFIGNSQSKQLLTEVFLKANGEEVSQ